MTSTGTIDLSSVSCGNAATLAGKNAMGTDILTIGLGGVLQTDIGAGDGGRTIDDDIVLAKGTFNVNANTTYTAEKKGLTNKKGTLNIAGGVTLTETAVTGSVFSQQEGRHRRIGQAGGGLEHVRRGPRYHHRCHRAGQWRHRRLPHRASDEDARSRHHRDRGPLVTGRSTLGRADARGPGHLQPQRHC